MSTSPEPAASSTAIGSADEAGRLRHALALMQDNAAELGAEVAELVMAPLRQRLAALEARDATNAGTPRLRQVTVLFIDVVDSTGLLRGLDAEDGHDVLDGALRRFGTAVHEHGGRVLRYTGDGLKAVFGMPEPAEDDPARAVRAGLEIMRHAGLHAAEVNRRYGLAGFALRAGVHTGPVAMETGAEDAHALVGATVHMAARLEQNAPVGGLCISHDTWCAVRGSFDVEAHGPLYVEGVDAPQPSYRVLGERSTGQCETGRGIDGVPTRLVGHEHKLADLQANSAITEQGKPALDAGLASTGRRDHDDFKKTDDNR